MNFIITMRQRTCALRRPARTIPIFKNQLIHRTDVNIYIKCEGLLIALVTAPASIPNIEY